MNPWICDGIPKDGKQYPNCSGKHEPYENFGTDCVVCGLPKEAVLAPTRITINRSSFPVVPVVVGCLLLLLAGGTAFFAYRFLLGNGGEPSQTNGQENVTNDSGDSIALGSKNSQFISQGEKILLDRTPEKDAGASQFESENWDGAIADYQSAVDANSNDPESRIYLNNAQAREAGNVLTVAVAVPITDSPNSAKEVLRGVAQAQEEFNQLSPGNPLEVAIVNYGNDLQSASIAEDIAKADILAVLGYGVDAASNQALKLYEREAVPVLSPLSTKASQSTLTIVPFNQKSNELLDSYVEAAGKTLSQYASKKNASPSAVVFYNSDSTYSVRLKQSFTNALSAVKGKVVKEVDVAAAGFDAETEIANATKGGANTAFLALSKNKVDRAVSIAEANQGNASLVLLGSDELYNPDILVGGGDAIANLVLSVPWSFQAGNPFADTAQKSWKGRVSWRTATAYDAMKTLAETVSKNPTRSGVSQKLTQGVTITGSATNFEIFQSVPLVIAVRGNSGPPGSQYQFDPLP